MNEQQAKSGFKTFAVTLILSLIIFGAVYYLITDNTMNGVDIENELSARIQAEEYSAFGELSTQKLDVPSRAILGGAEGPTETTESTVPDTGSNMTLGMIISITTLSFGFYIVVSNPRKFALKFFEKGFLRDMD